MKINKIISGVFSLLILSSFIGCTEIEDHPDGLTDGVYSTKKLLEKDMGKKMISHIDVYKLDIDIYYVITHIFIIKGPNLSLKKRPI